MGRLALHCGVCHNGMGSRAGGGTEVASLQAKVKEGMKGLMGKSFGTADEEMTIIVFHGWVKDNNGKGDGNKKWEQGNSFTMDIDI